MAKYDPQKTQLSNRLSAKINNPYHLNEWKIMHKKSLFHKLRYQLLQREVFSFLKTIGTLMPTRTLIEDFVFELDKSVKCNVNIEKKKRKKGEETF